MISLLVSEDLTLLWWTNKKSKVKCLAFPKRLKFADKKNLVRTDSACPI